MANFLLPDEEQRLQGNAVQKPTSGPKFLLPGEMTASESAVPVVKATVGTNPDEAGEARRISRERGIPMPVAEQALEQLRADARLGNVRRVMERSPSLARSMNDPTFSKLAHDDVENLDAVAGVVSKANAPERVLTSAEFAEEVRKTKASNTQIDWDTARQLTAARFRVDNTPGGVRPSEAPPSTLTNLAAGVRAAVTEGFAEQTRQGIRRIFGDFFGFDAMSEDAKNKGQQSQFRQFLETPKPDGLAGDVYQGVQSTAQSAPALALGLVNPAVGLGLMGVQSGAPAYQKYRDRGGDKLESATGAVLEGGAEVIFEKVPMDYFVKKFGRVGITEFLAGMLAREIPTEIATTIAQTATDTAIANPNKTWSQWASELPENIRQTVIGTVVQSGLLGGAGVVARRLQMREEDAARTEEEVQAVETLLKFANASKVRERDSTTFQQFVQQAAEDGPVQDIYVDARMFAQAAGENLDVLRQEMPSVGEQLDSALAGGRDLIIPVGEFAAKVPGTVLEQSLLDHIRTAEDMPSRAEAQTFMQEAAASLKEQAEKLTVQAQVDDVAKQSQQVVEQDMLRQLTEANRFTGDVNNAYAKLMSAFFGTLAARMNKAGQPTTAEEQYQKFALRVNAQSVAGDRQMDQNIPDRPLLREADMEGMMPPERTLISSEGGIEFYEAAGGIYATVDGREVGFALPLSEDPAQGFDVSVAEEQQRKGIGGRLFSMYRERNPNAPTGGLTKAGEGMVRKLGIEPNILKQSASLRRGTETLKRFGLDPTKKHTTRQVASALEARQREKYGSVARDDRSPETARKLAKWMVEEVLFEAQNPAASGVGWYSTKFQAALDTMAEAFPELATDKNARDLMTALIAVTSDGQKVNENFLMAMEVYGTFKESGKFASKRGHARDSSIKGNLGKIQKLHDELGPEGMRKFLMREITIAEINAMARLSGEKTTSDYTADTKMPVAATVFGPKLGAFYANLMGSSGYLTMDRWWSRTFNRYRGILVSAPTRQGLDRFKQLIGKPELSDDQAVAETVQYRKSYEARNYKDGTEIEKAANTIYKMAFENLEDAPFNASDRKFMVQTVKYAQQNLKRRGMEMSIADIQAVLWYYEKRLYGELGARQSADVSYEEAARRAVAARSGADRSAAVSAADTAGDVARGVQPGEELFSNPEPGADAFSFNQSSRLPAVGNPRRVATAEDFTGSQIKNLLARGDWTILTAENPAALQDSAMSNEMRMDALRARLKELGLKSIEVKGKYGGNEENSIAVIGIDKDQALALGREFGQESVLTNAGIVYVKDGSINPARGVEAKTGSDDNYTVLPDGTKFAVEIDWRNLWPAQELRIGEVQAVGVHFSKAPRNLLDPRFYGRGAKGAEAERVKASDDKRLGKRVHFYVNTGLGVKAERDVGNEAHVTTLTNLYDADGDPLGVWKSGRESGVLDAGFSGYLSRNALGGTAVVFENVKVEHVGDEAAANQTIAGQVAPPPQYTETRKLVNEFLADPRLFSGLAQVDEWRSTMEERTPEYVGMIPWDQLPKGERLYKDELVRSLYQGTLRQPLERAQVEDDYDGQTPPVPGAELRPYGTPDLLGWVHPDTGDVLMLAGGEGFFWVSPEAKVFIDEHGFGVGHPNRTIAKMYYAAQKGASLEPLRAALRKDFATIGGDAAADTEFDRVSAALSSWFNDLSQGDQARGQITFGNDITKTPSVITLLKNADLSTFLHEAGHFYLEVLTNVANQPNAPQEIVDDMDKLFKWFGVAGGLGEWNAMTLEQKRPHHEKFARGFEAYLFEGKAPSVELKSAFSRFRAWLINVYRQLAGLNVQLDDTVRGVFDRMIATEEQIKEAEALRGFAPIFKSAEDMGATPEEWAAYQNLHSDATETATEQLQARSLRDMQWTANARARALRKLQNDAAAKRKAIEDEVTAEVTQQPVYAVQRFLRYGELSPNVLFGKGVELAGKLDLAVLKEMYGEGPAAPWRYLATGTNGMAATEGVHPDLVAELFGFTSGDSMVRQILAAEPEATVVEGMTDQRMLERYGDLSSPAGLEKAANEAVHNEARGRFIATELAALNNAVNVREDTGRTVTDSRGRTRKITTNVMVKAAKDFATNLINRSKIKDIKPSQYATAEGRAAKNAERTKNFTEKVTEKRNQLVNHYAARAANDAVDYVEKQVAYLRKVADSETIDQEYRDQIQQLLEKVELRRVTEGTLRKRASLLEWIEDQEAKGLDPVIDRALVESAQQINYRTMTLEEFRGLVDTVKNIEHLGRLKHKLLTAKDERDLAQAVEELRASVEANHNREAKVRIETGRGLERLGKMARGFVAMHRKFASIAREMDGGKDGGPMWERLIRPMNEAGDNEIAMRSQATEKLSEIFKLLDGIKLTRKEQVLPGVSMTREARIMLALNWGNEGNRQRVIDGGLDGRRRLTQAEAEQIVFGLTSKEWDFVESMWAFVESYRPMIAEQEKRLTGVEPKWVEPAAFTLPNGRTIRGGYFPAKYDGELSSRSNELEAITDLRQQMQGAAGRSSTRNGYTKERSEAVKDRPLRKDFGVIMQHVGEVTHRLAWQDYLIDARRLLNAKPLDSAIREFYGPEILREMKEQLKDIAVGDIGAQSDLDRLLGHIRSGVTIAGMGWNLMTGMMQPLGLSQSIVRVGAPWMSKGLAHFAANPIKATEVAQAKSKFMASRSLQLNRDLSDILNKIDKEKLSKVENSYFWFIYKFQTAIDVPTWWGAYEKAIAENNEESRAIALADQAVIDAQGGGALKDQARIQRGGSAQKLFTAFYSFFNTTYNLAVEQGRTAGVKGGMAVPKLASDYLLLLVIPAIAGALLKAALKGELDDDELAKKLAAEQLNYLFGTMVLTREIGGGIAAAVNGFNYTGPASLRLFGEIGKFAKQAEQGELDAALFKAANNIAGIILHYPAGQVQRTVEGMLALSEGETSNPAAVLFGPPKN